MPNYLIVNRLIANLNICITILLIPCCGNFPWCRVYKDLILLTFLLAFCLDICINSISPATFICCITFLVFFSIPTYISLRKSCDYKSKHFAPFHLIHPVVIMFDLFLGRGGQSRATRLSTTYLFNSLKVMGLVSSLKWKPLSYLYSALNLSVVLYVPLTFTLSFFLMFGNMTTSQFLTSLQAAINAYGIPIKVISLKLYMKRLRDTEDIMNTLDARCYLKAEYRKIRNCIKICNRLAVFFPFTYGIYVLSTFLSSVFIGQPPYSLYMNPLNWRNSNWEFMLQSFIELLLLNGVCFHQSMVDGYAVIYIYIMRTHMQILVERVRRLGTEEGKSKDINYQELVECIKDHQNLLSLHGQISPVISVTIFVQFAITAAILGTTMINILIFANTSGQIGSVAYFLAVLVQTSPCCYQATCLLDDSEELPLAILQCNWMEEDKRFRKMLIFFMQRSQKPLELTAMKLFPVTLNTNLSIAKFSFSLYTFIKNMDIGRN